MMDIQNENLNENVSTQRETSLQSAISSLSLENHNKKLLENVKICIEYLSTFNLANVDNELLKWLMPVVQKSLQKIYDDNCILSDTADDDFVIDILKENLQMASDFLQGMKVILDYLFEYKEITLVSVKSMIFSYAQIILSTFEHCRNSSEGYKDTFSGELLDIFQKTQELHSLYLKMFETCIIIGDSLENHDERAILKQEILCAISLVLSDLNVKSMIMNWKGYTGIAQKFSNILVNYIDIKQPIHCLTSEIARNLQSLNEMESTDTKVVHIRKTGFLVKVVLKILEIFWNCLENIHEQVLDFCCTVYSYPPSHFEFLGYPEDLLALIENSIFTSLAPFMSRLVINETFIQRLSNENIKSERPEFLNFLCSFLKCLTKEGNGESLETVVRLIFVTIKQCFEEFSSPFSPCKIIFDDLVVHITASVINHESFYSKVEYILLENVLQEDVWCALLAMDIWCLLLGRATHDFRLETFLNLVKIYEKLEFGVNTHRLEKIFMRNLIRRVFDILPENGKSEAIDITKKNGTELWRITGFENYPVRHRQLVEDVCTSTVEKIREIKKDGFRIEDFVYIVENLESLSSANFRDMGRNSKNMVDAIATFWESSYSRLSNNVFNYFIRALCKMTGTLIGEFDNRQLFTILNQLKVFSTEDNLKIHVCGVLNSLADKNSNEFGQDKFKIFSLMSNVLYPSLISSPNNIVKQNALEILEKLVTNGKEEVVRDIMKASKEVKLEIVNYLQKEVDAKELDKNYFRSLAALEYTHQCVKWQSGNVVAPTSKRFKLDEVIKEVEEKPAIMQKPGKKVMGTKRHCQQHNNTPVTPEEDKTDVNEAIASIKGEVKSLMRVLKTEKLSQKNVSDLKMISNQLLSLM